MTFAALFLALLFPQGGSADRIAWRGDLPGALEKAKAEKIPIFIAFNMDGEQANDWTVEVAYREPKVVGRSRKFLCFAASKYEHETAREGDREVCARFGSVTCAEHRQVEKDARRLFLGGRTLVNAPQHLFVAPDGTPLFRREWLISAEALADLMTRALKEAEIDPGAGAASAPAGEFDREKWTERVHAKGVEKQREALERMVALDHPDAEGLLEAEFERADRDGRIEILRAMGEPGYERAVPFLLRVAGGREPLLRRHAIVSLEIVGSDKAAEALLQAAKKEGDRAVLKELLRAVAKLAPARKEVADLVLRRTSDSDDRLRANALVAAADLADVSRAREAARKALADKSADVRGCAIYALGLVGEKEDVARLKKLEEKETDFRVKVLLLGARTLLETEGGKDPEKGYHLALLFFAGDEIPHDGTWPAPSWAGKKGF
ncbi:MAG TPA: HEAT repeat domain-containing protein [Planctomycetota bacterium]|nr:HEAT repeat domain-containing protein [Planctomycetota bacterium]